MWDGRRREKAAQRRQTRFNSNGVMGIRSAMPQRRQFIILINAKGAEEREREGAGCGILYKEDHQESSRYDESASGVDDCIDRTKWVTY